MEPIENYKFFDYRIVPTNKVIDSRKFLTEVICSILDLDPDVSIKESINEIYLEFHKDEKILLPAKIKELANNGSILRVMCWGYELKTGKLTGGEYFYPEYQ